MKSKHAPTSQTPPNPISLRVWYPRLVDDASFARLMKDLRHIRAQRVYVMDNGYMDNFQLSRETLAERLPVLKKRIAALHRAGIITGINSGATIGHGGNMRGAERLMDLDWWVDAAGNELHGIACPLGARFGQWIDTYFKGLAETGTREIFIDDDLRMSNHGGVGGDSYGCFCPLHLAAIRRRCGKSLTRAGLVKVLDTLGPGRVQEEWMKLWKENFLDLQRRMQAAVHGVDPTIRLGLMPVQNFIRPFGEDFLRESIAIISGKNRPLLRTHDYHGLPHELMPGCGVAAKRSSGPAAEHVVEIENIAHNCHDFVRSPRTTRFAILSALATGMGGAAPTFGDSEQDMPWERRYLAMYRESDPFFRTVARLVGTGTVMRGVPIRHRAYQRSVKYLDVARDILYNDTCNERPDVLAGVYGFSYRFEEALPAFLLGELPRTMTPAQIRATLKRGAVIDLGAVRCLERLGYGKELGVKAGEPIAYRRGQRFLEHPLCGGAAGSINALRAPFPVHHLQADPKAYAEATEFVSWAGRRVAGGVLVRHDGKGRNVILPHLLSLEDPHRSGIVNVPYRNMIKRALEHVLGSPLTLSVDGPPRLAPFYFERPADGAVIVTILNGYYDDVHGFDLVFGDGARLARRPVYRVGRDGRLKPCPTLKIRSVDGAWRMRIDRANALANCDVMVLQIGGER